MSKVPYEVYTEDVDAAIRTCLRMAKLSTRI